MKPSSSQWREVYLCVALTTMATLLLELVLTRIFSVVFYYHFAFLAISIALFGLGLGGVFSYVVAGWKATAVLRSSGALSADQQPAGRPGAGRVFSPQATRSPIGIWR